MTELLVDAIPPLIKDEPAGQALVKQLFTITKKGVGKVKIAGCVVTEGKVKFQPCFSDVYRLVR